MQASPLTLSSLKKHDIDECVKIVYKATKEKNLKQKMYRHLRFGASLGAKDEKGNIIAFALWLYAQNGISLSHFYVDEFYRKKPFMLEFFTAVFINFKDKDVFINSRDVWNFKGMLEPTSIKDEYKFKKDLLVLGVKSRNLGDPACGDFSAGQGCQTLAVKTGFARLRS